jgi:hypothetical protein
VNHKYLSPAADHVDEAGYTVDEGIVVDPASEPTRYRRTFSDLSITPPSREELLAEEARWAARSFPCVTLNPGRQTP